VRRCLSPASQRYFTHAVTPSNQGFGYTTEGNDVVIALSTQLGCYQATTLSGHTHNILKLVLSQTPVWQPLLAPYSTQMTNTESYYGISNRRIRSQHKLLSIRLQCSKAGHRWFYLTMGIRGMCRVLKSVLWDGLAVQLPLLQILII